MFFSDVYELSGDEATCLFRDNNGKTTFNEKGVLGVKGSIHKRVCALGGDSSAVVIIRPLLEGALFIEFSLTMIPAHQLISFNMVSRRLRKNSAINHSVAKSVHGPLFRN